MSKLRDLACKLNALQVHREREEKLELRKLVVLDFEATCWGPNELRQPNEIIEFSGVLLDIPSGLLVDKIQIYVKPTENPILSAFCTKLTGIQQATVDNAVTLKSSLDIFHNFIEKNDLDFFDGSCAFATWSNWDLGTCLHEECERKCIYRKPYFDSWMDARKLFTKFYKTFPHGLMGALETMGLDFVGKQHCGLDDAINTAYLISKMYRDGAVMRITSSL